MSSTVKREASLPSARVIERVANAKRVAADELTPLYGSIDADALNALFQSKKASGTVQFQYEGYTVTVQSDGRIELASPNS